MDEDVLGRRGLLRTAGLAGGLAVTGLLASAAPALADDDDHDDDERGRRLLGSWLVTAVTPDGELLTVASFAAGNVVIGHDIRPAGPPFTGTWASKGRRFRATMWSGFPGDQGPGSPGPTARLRIEGRVEDHMISGTFTFTLFAPTGEELETVEGTFSGERIEA